MGAVVSLFHNKLDNLKNRYPLFTVTAIRETVKTGNKVVVYNYCVDISEDTSLYIEGEKEELKELDEFHSTVKKIKEFNKEYKNLKVFIEDPNVVWINYDSMRTPAFADFASSVSEIGKEKFKQLNEKAEFIKINTDYFICSHCHSLKQEQFRFSKFVTGDTCVACAEVDLDGIDC